jgi:hypothetical protein
LHHRLDNLVDILKPASFEGQATQLLPPSLNQVQSTGIRGDEPRADLRPCDQGRLGLPRHMGTQIIGEQYPLAGGIGQQDRSSSCMKLALSRLGLHRVVASPDGSKAPNTHTLPRRP